jgi:hypothetical protein
LTGISGLDKSNIEDQLKADAFPRRKRATVLSRFGVDKNDIIDEKDESGLMQSGLSLEKSIRTRPRSNNTIRTYDFFSSIDNYETSSTSEEDDEVIIVKY